MSDKDQLFADARASQRGLQLRQRYGGGLRRHARALGPVLRRDPAHDRRAGGRLRPARQRRLRPRLLDRNTFLDIAACCGRNSTSASSASTRRENARGGAPEARRDAIPVAVQADAAGSERGLRDRQRLGRAAGPDAAVRPAAQSRGAHRPASTAGCHDGCLILVEKVLGEHSTFNRLFINHYYELKRRNGYSELEIAQKREALENVLVPYRLEENKGCSACGSGTSTCSSSGTTSAASSR